MSRKAVLLIGELTHIEKEWKAWSSKYVLKVGCASQTTSTAADVIPGIHQWLKERLFEKAPRRRV